MKIEEFEFPDDLLYGKDHIWIKVNEKDARIGFTDLGQALYKGIMHIDLPEKGKKIGKGEELAPYETIKSVSKIDSPLTGKVTAVNEKLKENPEIINDDPYGKGWLIEMELENADEKEELMDIEEASKIFEKIVMEEKQRYAYLYE